MINHGDVLRKHMGKYDYYIFLNCESRGPFFASSNRNATTEWVNAFTNKLVGSVKAVGPTISCEMAPHVQSYALALHRDVVAMAADVWTQLDRLSPFQVTIMPVNYKEQIDVQLSAAILKSGYNIASMGDVELRGADFSMNSNGDDGQRKCQARRESMNPPSLQMLLNPAGCFYGGYVSDSSYIPVPEGSVGCRGLEPCDTVFVKYGGDLTSSSESALPIPTVSRVRMEEDHLRRAGLMCQDRLKDRHLYTPHPDVTSLYSRKIIKPLVTLQMRAHDHDTSRHVVLLPIKSSDIQRLGAFVETVKHLIAGKSIWLILLPLVPGEDNRAALAQDVANLGTPEGGGREQASIHISVAHFSQYPYKLHEKYLADLCPNVDFKVSCSPAAHWAFLKYFMIDIAVHDLKANCENCDWVFFMNYPLSHQASVAATIRFISQVLAMDSTQGDISMLPAHDFVTIPFMPSLYSHAVKLPYLRHACLSHFNVLPLYATAFDHERAPWLLMEGLRFRGRLNCTEDHSLPLVTCAGNWNYFHPN